MCVFVGVQSRAGQVGGARDAGRPPDAGSCGAAAVRQDWRGSPHYRPHRTPVLPVSHEPAGQR